MLFLLTYIELGTVEFFPPAEPDWSIQISGTAAIRKVGSNDHGGGCGCI